LQSNAFFDSSLQKIHPEKSKFKKLLFTFSFAFIIRNCPKTQIERIKSINDYYLNNTGLFIKKRLSKDNFRQPPA